MDFSALLLTDEDLSEYNGIGGTEFDYPWVAVRLRELADAQLAKALWGIQEWLTKASAHPRGYTLRSVLTELNTMLLAADIPKEGGG